MNAKCHQLLGDHLVKKYMSHLPKHHIRAFLIGCVQPDRNPTTYLKGSIRSTWLRGHNWNNAKRFMARICQRLENRKKMGILDYYALGKLIHYTTDSFTYAHNEHFTENLRQHQSYEKLLYKYFVRYLPDHKSVRFHTSGPIMEAIKEQHQEYMKKPAGVFNDSKYAINSCSMVMEQLVKKPSEESSKTPEPAVT